MHSIFTNHTVCKSPEYVIGLTFSFIKISLTGLTCVSSSEDGGASDFDLGPFEKRNARRELIFREETGQFREDDTKLGRQSMKQCEIYGGNQSPFLSQPQFSGRSRGRDFRRGWDRRRNRWIGRAKLLPKKSTVAVFLALKNPSLGRRKRERCLSGWIFYSVLLLQ